MKDNAIKIRDMHLLKSNNKLLSEINKNKENDEKIAAMGKDMGMLINKYEILKKKKLNKRDNKNDQRGYGMEDDSSEYGHGDTDEESVDDSEQSEDMNDNEINTRAPTSVFKSINTPTYPSRILNDVKFTYGTRYYEFPTGAGIGGLLHARYSRGIGGLLKQCTRSEEVSYG